MRNTTGDSRTHPELYRYERICIIVKYMKKSKGQKRGIEDGEKYGI